MLLKYSISILLFLGSLCVSNAQLISKKEFRLGNFDRSNIHYNELQKQNRIYLRKTTQKELLFAGMLSFAVPGAALGQFYKEEFVNGAVRVGISAVCIAWFFLSPTFNYGGGGDATQKLIATGIYAVNWIASIIDAASPRKYPTYRRFRNYNYSF